MCDCDSDCEQSCNRLEKFFKDGKYSMNGRSEPSCVNPNGLVYTGTCQIKSNYKCNTSNTCNKNLIQKYFIIQTGTINAFQYFNIDSTYILASSLGGAKTGKYCFFNSQSGEQLIVKFYGYASDLGRNAKGKVIYTKVTNGYIEEIYYKIGCEYVQSIVRNYVKLLNN